VVWGGQPPFERGTTPGPWSRTVIRMTWSLLSRIRWMRRSVAFGAYRQALSTRLARICSNIPGNGMVTVRWSRAAHLYQRMRSPMLTIVFVRMNIPGSDRASASVAGVGWARRQADRVFLAEYQQMTQASQSFSIAVFMTDTPYGLVYQDIAHGDGRSEAGISALSLYNNESAWI